MFFGEGALLEWAPCADPTEALVRGLVGGGALSEEASCAGGTGTVRRPTYTTSSVGVAMREST